MTENWLLTRVARVIGLTIFAAYGYLSPAELILIVSIQWCLYHMEFTSLRVSVYLISSGHIPLDEKSLAGLGTIRIVYIEAF